ncbi:hypothetical protein FRB99_005797 [Tulasnella sp. 403]|nr:hypothetical protein FRB99_005797 [Tulasnella sp. 403]
MAPVSHFNRLLSSFRAAITSILSIRASIPPLVQVRPREIRSVVSERGKDLQWLPVKSIKSSKSVVPIDDKQIILGWRKGGPDRHHFGAFSFCPRQGEGILHAARRDLDSAAGLKPTRMQALGRILFVNEATLEGREEVIYRASAWSGDPMETDAHIPAIFHTASIFTPTKEKEGSFSDSAYSTDTLPSFHPMADDAEEPRSSLHYLIDAFCFGSSHHDTKSMHQADTKRQSNFDDTWCCDLLLPWHCMHPDEMIYYPLLISGKHFVGRVDYSASEDGGVGEIRKWWFAGVDN